MKEDDIFKNILIECCKYMIRKKKVTECKITSEEITIELKMTKND